MATAHDKPPAWMPKTAAGRLRQRARQAAMARGGGGTRVQADPTRGDDSFEARRKRELLAVVHGYGDPGASQTGVVRGDVAGPREQGPPRPLARPGFEEGVELSVTRLGAGRAKDMGAGTLLYDLAIGEACQVAIPDAGVLRTTPVRSVSVLSADAVQIVTQRSTYRLRRKSA